MTAKPMPTAVIILMSSLLSAKAKKKKVSDSVASCCRDSCRVLTLLATFGKLDTVLGEVDGSLEDAGDLVGHCERLWYFEVFLFTDSVEKSGGLGWKRKGDRGGRSGI